MSTAAIEYVAVDGRGGRWRSNAQFEVTADGRVDAAVLPSLAGTYTGIDPLGLLWSLRSDDPRVGAPRGGVFNITVRCECAGQRVECVTQRATLMEQLEREVISEDGVRGDLYRPRTSGALPGVVVVGGTEGGRHQWVRAGLLAGRGYATLVVPLFGETGLPRTLVGIDVERITAAAKWLRAHPATRDEPVGLLGVSAGGTGALLACARSRDIGPTIVIGSATAPMPARPISNKPTWRFGHQSIAQVSFTKRSLLRRGVDTADQTSFAGSIVSDASADAVRIDISGAQGPVELHYGADDPLIPRALRRSPLGTDAAGLAPRVSEYPGAGHSLNPPGLPSRSVILRSFAGVEVSSGGTAAANAAAGEQVWRRTLEVFRGRLGPPIPWVVEEQRSAIELGADTVTTVVARAVVTSHPSPPALWRFGLRLAFSHNKESVERKVWIGFDAESDAVKGIFRIETVDRLIGSMPEDRTITVGQRSGGWIVGMVGGTADLELPASWRLDGCEALTFARGVMDSPFDVQWLAVRVGEHEVLPWNAAAGRVHIGGREF